MSAAHDDLARLKAAGISKSVVVTELPVVWLRLQPPGDAPPANGQVLHHLQWIGFATEEDGGTTLQQIGSRPATRSFAATATVCKPATTSPPPAG